MNLTFASFIIDNKDSIRESMLDDVNIALVSYTVIEDNALFYKFIVYNIQEFMINSMSNTDRYRIMEEITEEEIRLVAPDLLNKEYWRKKNDAC